MPSPATSNQPASSPRAAPRVLVVEDHPAMGRLLTTMLTDAGIACDLAADGQEAFRLFAQQPYDLVLLDLAMPGWDGLLTRNALEVAFPEARIIVQSAYADEPLATQLRQYENVVAVFKKPYDAARLLAVVRE
ncbi:MAG: response regulator [Planctomycetes bacterium]|nr:response regulator [Planctomycetota bacterium]